MEVCIVTNKNAKDVDKSQKINKEKKFANVRQ